MSFRRTFVRSYRRFRRKTEILYLRFFQKSNVEIQVNLCQKLFFLQNMRRTCYVQKLFLMSETISVHYMFSPGLSLRFSCIDFVSNSMNNLLSYCGLVDAKIRTIRTGSTYPLAHFIALLQLTQFLRNFQKFPGNFP